MSDIIVTGKQEFLGKQVPIIKGGFGENQKCVLASTIAEIHGKEVKHINELIKNNMEEFEEGIDLLDLMSNDFKMVRNIFGFIKSNNQKYCYLLSEQGYSKLYSFLRDKNEQIFYSVMNNIFESNILYIYSNVYNKEIRFRERLGKILNQLDIEYKFQHKVLNYRIDIYIPSLNTAIEYDEGNHKYYSYKQHNGRQAKIEKELGCRFIRVNDSYDIDTAIGIVLKNIYLGNSKVNEILS